ncbi:MAG: hypothetical protein ACI4TX_02735 [Christensenellales bacterium]
MVRLFKGVFFVLFSGYSFIILKICNINYVKIKEVYGSTKVYFRI